ncbi:MAG: hypothetical protein AABX55_01480 [Nanoarchaeota archaeon]
MVQRNNHDELYGTIKYKRRTIRFFIDKNYEIQLGYVKKRVPYKESLREVLIPIELNDKEKKDLTGLVLKELQKSMKISSIDHQLDFYVSKDK